MRVARVTGFSVKLAISAIPLLALEWAEYCILLDAMIGSEIASCPKPMNYKV